MFFLFPIRPRYLGMLVLLAMLNLLGRRAGAAEVVVFSTASAKNISMNASDSPALNKPLVCDWVVQCAQANNTVVTWVGAPFVHPHAEQFKCDAQLQLIPLETSGPTSAVVVQGYSITNNGGKAIVSAIVSGTGVAKFRVIISMLDDKELRLAGQYTTTVHAAAFSK